MNNLLSERARLPTWVQPTVAVSGALQCSHLSITVCPDLHMQAYNLRCDTRPATSTRLGWSAEPSTLTLPTYSSQIAGRSSSSALSQTLQQKPKHSGR